jgi:tetratricopeptide (TPR) repeat protein
MDAVTYPNKAVIDFINANMIPLRILHNQRPLADEFKIRWTPTIITLDAGGIERQRTIGFLPPDQLIPSLMLGIGKAHLERGEFAQAIPRFEKVVSQYPKSGSAPEAVFYLGVARFQRTHDPKFLKKAYEELAAQYPKSQWTTKASPYSSIK